MSSACALLQTCGGSTDQGEVVAALDLLRSSGSDASGAAEMLADLLPHRCALYENRDKLAVLRLRAYIMLTLSDVGVPSAAVPFLLETLAHVDPRMNAVEIGSAVRAVGALGRSARAFAPHLLRTMSGGLAQEEFTLERYEQVFTPAEATTIQLEVIDALGRICAPTDVREVELLRRIVSRSEAEANRRLADAASAALERMGIGSGK